MKPWEERRAGMPSLGCTRLIVCAGLSLAVPVVLAQVGPSHEEGNSYYKRQCNSTEPKAAIAACTHLIDDPAIADLSIAINLNPRDSLAFTFRSSAYAERKDFQRANADAAMARQLDPAAKVQLHRDGRR